jgi:hypothetical protein
MAIMVSCRALSRRCRPSAWPGDELATPGAGACELLLAATEILLDSSFRIRRSKLQLESQVNERKA